MEARFLMEKLEAELGKEVFLDSDDLKVGLLSRQRIHSNDICALSQDLRKLLDHVRASDALVVLQSSEVLHRPWCILEMFAAIQAGVPIVCIAVSGKVCRCYPLETETALNKGVF